jgi:hypothetical protein
MARHEFAHSHGGPLDQYYASSGWAKRREVYFARYGRRCEACASTDQIDVHHSHYRNLYEEGDEDLVAMCRSCHAECHHLQAELGWQLEDMTRRFLDYRKQRQQRDGLAATNHELRRRQDALLRRKSADPPSLELSVQEVVKVGRKAASRRQWLPTPRSQPGTCNECGRSDSGVSSCDACHGGIHPECSRHRRALICSVECSIDWMEAFGHA